MAQIDEHRNRLAALSVDGCQSLAACRALQNGLRKLKRDVLAQILTLRTRSRREAREAMATEPTLRNLWKRRNDLVDDLIDNVKEQLTGDADDEDMEALEAWAEINREIDSRLDRLEELEDRLAEAAGEEVVRRPSLSGRPRIDASDADDELYAAVGAESRRRRPPAASCPECGGKVEPGDRFCGQCGHRLGSADR